VKRVFYPLVKLAARVSLLTTALAAARHYFEHQECSRLSREETLWYWQHPTAAFQAFGMSWVLTAGACLALIAGFRIIIELRRGEGPAANCCDMSVALVEKPYLLIPLIAYIAWAIGLFMVIGDVSSIPLPVLCGILMIFHRATER